ncbi:MAG: ABC transporter ATP-binding protein [Dermatophilaceae bacterium]
MIRQLRTVLSAEWQGQYTSFLVWTGLYGALQGLAVALLVPIARSLHAADFGSAWRWTGALAIIGVLCSIAHYVQAMGGFQVALAALRSMHQRIGDHLVMLPLGWFTGKTGSIAQIASKGTLSVGVVAAHLLTPVIIGITAPATVIVAMLFYDWRLGLALLATVPVIVGVGRVGARLIARSEHATHAAEVAVNDRVLEFARCQPVLRAFGRSHDVGGYRPLSQAIASQNAVARRALFEQVAGSSLNGFAVQAVFSFAVIVTATLALGGTITAIDLLALLGVTSRFTGPLTDVADYSGHIRGSRAELDRIQQIMDAAPLPEPARSAPVSKPGAVAFEHVSFGYEAGTPVLHDISFTVAPNTVTALVGPSGSGKTTISRLIARFWDADAGIVRVGGVDVREQTTQTLMNQVALVFQDVYIFDDTLRANIRMGDPDAADAQVDRAAELAGVTEIAERLPDGWFTQVGEAGSALSGGERQRVSIARALLKRAPIVLLDEATAALDPENQRYVHASLDFLRRHTTLLVIAHQLTTVMTADQIIVLDDHGHITETGRHHDLITRPDGCYAAFWNQRSRSLGWRLLPSAPASDTG